MAKLKTMSSRLGRVAPRLRLQPKTTDPFYLSVEWRRLVAAIKRKRGAWCERCGSKQGLIADHIVERKDGGAELDERNIELLCRAHHQQKTAAARARRASGGGR